MKWSKKTEEIRIITDKETKKLFFHFKIENDFSTNHDLIKYLLEHNDKMKPKPIFGLHAER